MPSPRSGIHSLRKIDFPCLNLSVIYSISFGIDCYPHHCISLSQSSVRQDSVRESHLLNCPMFHPQHVEYSRNMSCCPGAQAAVLETLSVTTQFLVQIEGCRWVQRRKPPYGTEDCTMRSFAGSSVVLLPLRGGGDIKGIRRGGKSSGNRELGSKSWCLRTDCGGGRI